jgi:hypothetical protein
VYISNVELPGGEQGWKPTHDSWQTTVNLALGYLRNVLDITKFKRVTQTTDKRLILVAPDMHERRTLVNALQTQRSPLTAKVHLSPRGKRNKTLVHKKTIHADVKIDDKGDQMIVSWRKDNHTEVKIDLLKETAVVADRLDEFLEDLLMKEVRRIPPTLPAPPKPTKIQQAYPQPLLPPKPTHTTPSPPAITEKTT